VLRGSRGEVAGAKLGASSVERLMSEHGNRRRSVPALRIRRGVRAGHTVCRSVCDGAEPS
jgi:hypothetical protein